MQPTRGLPTYDGDVHDFFEFLAELGILDAPDAVNVIGGMEAKELRATLEACYWLVNEGGTRTLESDLFTFSANSAMSGGAYPCASVGCRLDRAYRLGVFAALYANAVYVPNLFEYGYHQSFGLRSSYEKAAVINRFIGDIAVYFQYRPLIAAGHVGVNRTAMALCSDCLRERLLEEDGIERRVVEVIRQLDRQVAGRITFTLGPDRYISVTDADGLLEEQPAGFMVRAGFVKPWIKKAPYQFSEPEVRQLRLRENILDMVTTDLLLQKWSYYAGGTSYLTSRKLDSMAIELVKPDDKAAERSLPSALEHMIPMPPDLDVRRAIKFRSAEPEIFENYRATVNKLVRRASGSAQADIADAVRSEVKPELATISAAMRNHRRSLRTKAGANLLFFALTAGIVEASGIFGSASAAASLASSILLGAIGSVGANAVAAEIEARQVSEAVASNPYYFLWKVNKF